MFSVTTPKINRASNGWQAFVAPLSLKSSAWLGSLLMAWMIVNFITLRSDRIFLPDYVSYTNAWDVLLSGRPDVCRTPLYPCFIGVMELVFGNVSYYAIAVVQWIVFLVASVYFAKTLYFFTSNKRIIFWATAFYCLFPEINTWNMIVQTEGLAMSFMTFFIFFSIAGWKHPGRARMITLFIWLLMLIMLRPSFIYLIPLTGLYVVLLWIRGRKSGSHLALFGAICWFVVVGFQLGYIGLMNYHYGIHSPSIISTTNNYFTIRDGAIDEETDFQTDSPAIFESRVNDSLASHKGQFLSYVAQRFYFEETNDYLLKTYYYYPLREPFFFLTGFITIGTLSFLLMLYPVWIGLRRDFTGIWLWILAVGMLIVNSVGAPSEWGRLFLPALPAVLIIMTDICSHLKYSESRT